MAISGNQHSQLFTLSGSAQITVANLTLTQGVSSQGGAVFIGGGAALTLDSDLLSGNQAIGDSNGNALGGAVYNSAGASLTIDHTLFVNNQTNGTQVSFGGAIANAGTLSIQAATFTDNAALVSTTEADNPPGGSQGGAIGNLDGAISTLVRRTFTGNQALGNGAGDGQGGAMCNELAFLFPFTGTGVTSSVSQCTFDNNLAQGGSTAINGGYIENNHQCTLNLTNSTVSTNLTQGGAGARGAGGGLAAGGGIGNDFGAIAIITNSTLSNHDNHRTVKPTEHARTVECGNSFPLSFWRLTQSGNECPHSKSR